MRLLLPTKLNAMKLQSLKPYLCPPPRLSSSKWHCGTQPLWTSVFSMIHFHRDIKDTGP